VGYVGLDTCATAADVATLRGAARGVELADTTASLVDLMVHKSDEEKRLQRSTAEVLAEAHRRFAAALRPGMTEREAVGSAVSVVYGAGCIDGIAHLSNQPAPFIRPPTDRVIGPDDVLRFSMEFAGPDGYWIELSAVYSFRSPSAEDQRLFDTTLRAFNLVGEMLRPGTVAEDLAIAARRVFEEEGYTDLGRAIWDAHGIGINVIEPPLALTDDTSVLEEGMVINVHPGVVVGDLQRGIYLQDNFEVSAIGGIRQSGLEHRWNVV
jgi:Xaa-Pro dipeptidase